MERLLNKAICVLPFVFLLHNVEEAFTIEKFIRKINSNIYPNITTKQFVIAVSLITILGFILIFAKRLYQNKKQFSYINIGFSGMMFLNVFFPHLIATLTYKMYTPGIVTALFLNLPLTSYIIWAAYKTQRLSLQQITQAVLAGGLIGVVLAFTLLTLSRFLAT